MSWAEIKKAVNNNLNEPINALINRLVGATTDTGGSTSTGSVMAKLNKVMSGSKPSDIDGNTYDLITDCDYGISRVLTSDSTSYYPHSGVVKACEDTDFIYAAYEGLACVVLAKIQKSNLQVVNVSSLTDIGNKLSGMCQSGSYIYISNVRLKKVYKISKSTFAVSATSVDFSALGSGYFPNALACDATYVYTANNGLVVKLKQSDMSTAQNLSIATSTSGSANTVVILGSDLYITESGLAESYPSLPIWSLSSALAVQSALTMYGSTRSSGSSTSLRGLVNSPNYVYGVWISGVNSSASATLCYIEKISKSTKRFCNLRYYRYNIFDISYYNGFLYAVAVDNKDTSTNISINGYPKLVVLKIDADTLAIVGESFSVCDTAMGGGISMCASIIANAAGVFVVYDSFVAKVSKFKPPVMEYVEEV